MDLDLETGSLFVSGDHSYFFKDTDDEPQVTSIFGCHNPQFIEGELQVQVKNYKNKWLQQIYFKTSKFKF